MACEHPSELGVRRVLFEGKRGASAKEVLLEAGAECVDSRSSWYTFFDNQAYALTKRGWWLAKVDEDWLLRVPLLTLQNTSLYRCRSCKRTVVSRPEKDVCRCGAAIDDGCIVRGYLEEYTAPDEILEVSGLTDFADLLRSGKAKSVEGLLGRSEVRPFASTRARREQFLLKLEDGLQLKIDVSELTFDTKTAENRAVAELLFYPGQSSQISLTATLIEFTPSGEGPFLSSPGLQQLIGRLKQQLTDTISGSSAAATSGANAATAAAAAAAAATSASSAATSAAAPPSAAFRSLCTAASCGVSEWVPFPEAVAFMRRLRPHHLTVINDPMAEFLLKE